MMKTYINELYHHGIKGQQWGVRNGPPYPLNPADYSKAEKKEFTAYRESSKKITKNPDGSYSIPKGFEFNRVGKNTTDVRTNESGALYVSYGKEDAARYVKIYGPDLANRIFNNTREAVQHISSKGQMKLASDEQFVSEAGKFLQKNPDIAKELQKDSFFNAYLKKKSTNLNNPDNIKRMISNPNDRSSKLIAYSLNSMLIDSEGHKESAKKVYDHFRKKGFDAIPDIHDTWGGTSETAMIVINSNKVKVSDTTVLTKDVFQSGKEYVKTLEKIKVDDILR